MRLIEEMTNSRIVAGARGTIGLIDVSFILCCNRIAVIFLLIVRTNNIQSSYGIHFSISL